MSKNLERKRFAVHCEWDSYAGSLFKETHTEWVNAYTEADARSQVGASLGYRKGFKIRWVDLE